MTGLALVLSPHLDDAVFSAAGRLMAADSMVVTVFAGLPEPGQPPGEWDRLTGATCARDRMLERLREDDMAMRALGCRTRRLAQLDEQYRRRPADQAALRRQLEPLLGTAAELWIPAGLGGHPDHLAVRTSALAVLRQLGTRGAELPAAVFLYADVPYAIRHGWPSWVDPGNKPDFVDPDYWLTAEAGRRGLPLFALTPSVRELPAVQRARKLAAVSAYRTQLGALRMGRLIADRAASLLRYELSWRADLDAWPHVCHGA